MAGGMALAVGTADGVIPLRGGGDTDGQARTFNLHWNTETPTNVMSVTAVIINGIRIPTPS